MGLPEINTKDGKLIMFKWNRDNLCTWGSDIALCMYKNTLIREWLSLIEYFLSCCVDSYMEKAYLSRINGLWPYVVEAERIEILKAVDVMFNSGVVDVTDDDSDLVVYVKENYEYVTSGCHMSTSELISVPSLFNTDDYYYAVEYDGNDYNVRCAYVPNYHSSKYYRIIADMEEDMLKCQ